MAIGKRNDTSRSAVADCDLATVDSRPSRELSHTVLQEDIDSPRAGDDDLLKALLRGAGVEHAARVAGVNELAVHERLADPAFKQRVESGREALRDSVLSQLTDAGSDAVSRLWRLLGNEDPEIQLKAAKVLLDSLVRVQSMTPKTITKVRYSVERTQSAH